MLELWIVSLWMQINFGFFQFVYIFSGTGSDPYEYQANYYDYSTESSANMCVVDESVGLDS